MKITKQGESECMLATISALSRVPLTKIRERALEIAKADNWAVVVQSANIELFWATVNKLKREFGVPYLMSLLTR